MTLIGTPGGVARLTGIAFDSSGNLYGSTITGGGFPPPPPLLTSNLIQVNPASGALIQNIGPITGNGSALSMADIAIEPGSNVLYGIEAPNDGLNQQGDLWTINPHTGVATLVGNTGFFFDTIAFAPSGTLYLSYAQFAGMGPVNPALGILNPATAQIISSVPTADFFGALAVRPGDNVIFGSPGAEGQLLTLNPNTGAETLVGSTGPNLVGALAFAPVPEPGTLGLLGAVGILAGFVGRRRFLRH